MKNIITYLKVKGHCDFNEMPFNEVDSLLLCQLSYIEFERYIPTLEEDYPPINIRMLNDVTVIEKIIENTINPKCNRKMLPLLLTSRRFREMDVNYAKIKIDDEEIEQFGAMTFIFPDFVYIALRGTDLSLLGWKEDFHLALQDQIPAQRDALNYLNEIAKKTDLPIYIGGHSKGGNLAVYASYFATASVKQRIVKIYNHDGPGFRKTVFDPREYAKLSPKIHKTVPKDTKIGILLNHTQANQVVKCRSLGIFQHDPYNWLLNSDYGFKVVKKQSFESEILDKTIEEFMSHYTKEEAAVLIEIVFSIAGHHNTTSVGQIFSHPVRYFLGLGKHYILMDKSEKEKIITARKLLSKIWKKNLALKLNGITKNVKIDVSGVLLETNRLYLRQFKEEDLDDFYDYAKVNGVGEMAGWLHHEDLETTRKVLKHFINGKNVFAIVFKKNAKVIGSIGIHESDDSTPLKFELKHFRRNMGYILSRDYWGAGIMPEAAAKVIEYCFTKTKTTMITCGHFTENKQSKRVIEKLGFVYYKETKNSFPVGDKEIKMYYLTKKKYKKSLKIRPE